MDDAKRRALIKAQAAKKKKSSDVALSVVVAINPSTKRKSAPKSDRQVKKPKVSLELVVGLVAEGKTVTPTKHGAGPTSRRNTPSSSVKTPSTP